MPNSVQAEGKQTNKKCQGQRWDEIKLIDGQWI